jgi:hypothetical protein
VASYFDFRDHYDFDSFLDEIEIMINFKRDLLKKIAFQIYDFDSDHMICNLDLYTFLKNYEHDDDCLIKAYSCDLAVLSKHLQIKRNKLGLKDCEIKFKLKEIDDKMREIGGELDVKMLEDFNPKAALEDSDSGFSDAGSSFSR